VTILIQSLGTAPASPQAAANVNYVALGPAWDNGYRLEVHASQPASPDFAQLKSNMKASWVAGDFGKDREL